MVIRLVALATLGVFAAVPAAAPAQNRVVAAYAYFQPFPQGNGEGRVHYVFRTADPLPEDAIGQIAIPSNLGYLLKVSPALHCYEGFAYVSRGPKAFGRPGDRRRVRIGRKGSLMDRVLTIRRYRKGYDRGGAIGCTKDPASGFVIWGTTIYPMLEPRQIFFAANSAPYITDLTWTGWGTTRAVGEGTYVNECSSGDCTPTPFRAPTTVVFDTSKPCPSWGARVYGGHATVYGDGPDDPRERPIPANVSTYC